MTKTLANAKNDKRVYSITRVSSEEFRDENIKYEINLNDGFMFDDGSHIEYAETVKDIWNLLDSVEVESEEE